MGEPMLPGETHCLIPWMNCDNGMERVTGIEPASRAWEPLNAALVQTLTCGQPWSWLTRVDRC